MKKPFNLFLAFLSTTFLFSQNYCDYDDCLFWEQQPEPVLGDTVIYAANQCSIDEWDNNLGCGFFNQCENLWLEVYYPDLPAGEKRPLVVLIHGGGFIQGSRAAFRNDARYFASLGYVAATIDYRLCKRGNCVAAKINPFAICNLNYASDLLQSSYVAVVDAQNAIRFLQDHADDYHIDPNNIIVGGHSAGGWTSLNVAYLDQQEANAYLSPNFQSTWGDLSPVDGIKGVFNLAGGAVDTAIFENGPAVPAFLVHGTCDPVVCYDYDPAFHCTTFPNIHGSANMALKLKSLGVSYYLFTGMEMGHDVAILRSIWEPELLRFMRETMLCGEFVQQHSISAQNPGSQECSTLANNPIPGAYSHGERDVVNIPALPLVGPDLCMSTNTQTPETTEEGKVRVFPNPAKQFLQIETEENTTIKWFDSRGILLTSFTVNGRQPKRLDITDMGSGIFLLTVFKENGTLHSIQKIFVNP